MAFVTGGSFPASLVPAQQRMALNTNYLDFTGGANDFAQQYLPELYEQEVERYGNRTLSGFLRMVGAEMPMTSDQVVWSEQNRLHIAYTAATVAVPGGLADADITVTLNLATALPDVAAANRTGSIRTGQTVLISDNATGLIVQKGIVQQVTSTGPPSNDILDVKFYGTATNALPTAADGVNIYVYGSDFGKGSIGMNSSVEPSFTQYSNSPIFLKDQLN